MKRTLTLKTERLTELSQDELTVVAGGSAVTCIVKDPSAALDTWCYCLTGNYSIVC